MNLVYKTKLRNLLTVQKQLKALLILALYE